MKFSSCSLNVDVVLLLLCAFLLTHDRLMRVCEADVGAILPQDKFDQFLSASHNGPPCNTNFYTRDSFLAAAGAFQGFATTGSLPTQETELAAFFAHVAHETGRGCYTDEIGNNDKYHGRGPLQLTGQSNYQAAGDYLGVDLVDNPNLLSTDATLSFKSAIWFWMNAGSSGTTCHSTVVNQQGFGPTTRIINGIECNGGHPDEQQDRVSLYQSFCGSFGISCNNQLYC